MQNKDGTTVLHFGQIQFVRPAAAQFEPPARYARYLSPDVLLIGAAQRQVPIPKVTIQQKTNNLAQKNAATKGTMASKSTNAPPIRATTKK
jgi:hypothetical protein